MERSSSLVPGFRFHPTDPELVMYYLKRKILGKKIIVNAVAEINIYDFSPWDLPDKSSMKSGDLKWYFFCPKARKYTSGSRANRATESGFWKATGKDRTVKYKERTVATIKTLVFHLGHAGNGQRTDWVMHEYKMEDQQLADQGIVQDTYVLCIVFKKDGAGPKNGAQYGAPFNEEEWDDESNLEKGPVSSTVTFCANETAKNKQKNKIVNRSACGLSITEPGSGSGISTVTYETGNCKQKGSATMNKVHLMSLTELGSASGTSANDDVMYYEDFATIMGVSTEDLNGNNNKNKGVEVDNTKEGKDMAPNEDDGIFDDLVNLMNLDDMNRDASNMFNTDEAYMLNTIMEADDLDVNLGKFCVD